MSGFPEVLAGILARYSYGEDEWLLRSAAERREIAAPYLPKARNYAAAVRAHLTALAADEQVRERVAQAIFDATDVTLRKRYEDGNSVSGYDNEYADAAVAAFLAAVEDQP